MNSCNVVIFSKYIFFQSRSLLFSLQSQRLISIPRTEPLVRLAGEDIDEPCQLLFFKNKWLSI
jgi:hypothetical protein